MVKRVFVLATMAIALGAPCISAQTCANTKLSCLIPTALHTTSSAFNFVNEAFGTQIGQLPLASPASGFVYQMDKSGVYTSFSESFGPLLAERSETIGRNKFYLAFTYQRFQFSNIDGTDIKNIPVLFYFPSLSNPQVVTMTQNRIDTKIDQFVAFGTFGLTNRLDVSVAVPFERISMGVSSKGTEYSTTTTASASFSEFVPGSAKGVGDVLVSAKYGLLRSERFGVSGGVQVRFPTGDERNFLGSGAYGVKPFLVVSRRGRVAPHLNIGYQWNGSSFLATDANGSENSLPGDFAYTAGADIGVTKRVTVVGDLLGQHFFSAPQISKPTALTANVNNQSTSFTSVQAISSASYDVENLSIGFKANPIGNLLVSVNALVKLNDGGLRATVVPLVGISYSF
ncbi:MAG TPA: hypothetical protein VMU05_00930 [Dongiaceae bacterium]|nr:hypothetical protein [Dongiaceae bacterium]